MPWDDWRKDFNKKLDDFGEDAKHKFRQQREANTGGSSGSRVGLQDRMNMLKGENPRWNRDVESRASAGGAQGAEPASTVVPERSRVPPAPPSALNKGRPPPPPSRHSGSAAGAPPALPARMQNEDGTSNPPPPYPPQTQHAYPTSQGAGHIEFSRFTQQDKEAFFELLDEYFDQRERGLR